MNEIWGSLASDDVDYNNNNNTKVQGWLRQKKIYTNADRPDDDDQQFDGNGDGGVRGHVRERVVRPNAAGLTRRSTVISRPDDSAGYVR